MQYNLTDQIIGHGFVIRQLHRAFGVLVFRGFLRKGFHAARPRIEPDMAFARREMHKVSVQYIKVVKFAYSTHPAPDPNPT